MNRQSYNGLLVVDKPAGMTSRDVVNQFQRHFPRKTRIGHAGTLDPLATGVLVLCVGAATRLTEYVQRMVKVYQTQVRFGATSDTDDIDGIVTENPDVCPFSRKELDQALREFVGEIEQIPPVFSANRIDGRRAYELARSGKDVALSPKMVHVHRIDVLDFQFPFVDLEIECGKGTYIRSIARDLGERLANGALVETLRRTRIGPFGASDAVQLNTEADAVRERLLPLGMAVLELPCIQLDDAAITKWRQGQSVAATANVTRHEQFECAVYDEHMELVGVGVVEPPFESVRPMKVLPK